MYMKKQVVFISGGEVFENRSGFKSWLSGPDSDFMLPQPGSEPVSFWSRNLGEDLGEEEFEVLSISMPLKQHAQYDEWKIWFEKHIQFMNDQVTLVGWSLGANFFAKYLSENTLSKNISSLHLVAGCFGCGGGFDLSDDLSNVATQSAGTFIYHSTDDPVVPFTDAQKYTEVIAGSGLVEFADSNHFLVPHISELISNIIESA